MFVLVDVRSGVADGPWGVLVRVDVRETVAGTAYAYCGGNWWSYDTPSTIAGKMGYMKSQGLGGAFVWELSGDTGSGTLISAVYSNR